MTTRRSRFALCVITLVFAGLTYFFAANFHTAVNYSRHKKTMAVMRDAAILIEHGKSADSLKDAWGTPLQVRGSRVYYSIRSAGSDRKFENTAPRGYVEHSGADIVVSEGVFVQYLLGI
jgi:hypothetical protein